MMFMPELNHISCLTHHTAGFTAITYLLKHLQHIILLAHSSILCFYALCFFLLLWWLLSFELKTSLLVSLKQVWGVWQWSANCDHHLQGWTVNPFPSLLVLTEVISHTLSSCRSAFATPAAKIPFFVDFLFYLLRITVKLSTTILSKMVSRSTAIKNGCGEKNDSSGVCLTYYTSTKSCRL